MMDAEGKIVFDDTPAKLKKRSSKGSLDDIFRELTQLN